VRISAPMVTAPPVPRFRFGIPAGLIHRSLAGLGQAQCVVGEDDGGDPVYGPCPASGSGDPSSDTGAACSTTSGTGIMDASGNCDVTAPYSGSPSSSPSGGLTPAQIAALLSGSSTLLKSTQSPYLIPGTNVVYNPATGQIVGSSGSITASSIASSLGSLMPMLLIIVAAVVFLPSLGKK
jgi:hypothetical protein